MAHMEIREGSPKDRSELAPMVTKPFEHWSLDTTIRPIARQVASASRS